MKAYIVQSNKKIEPFGDSPRDCLIANRKLSEIQRQVLQSLGMELKTIPDAAQIEDPDEHIILADSLFFTKELMKGFINRSRRLKSCTTCALKPGLVTLHSMVATQDVKIYADRVEYALRYMPAQRLRGEPVPVVIDVEQFSQVIPMPEHVRGPQPYRMPLTDTLLIQIDHWTNLWAANMATRLAELAKLMKAPKLKLLWLALKARSLNKWRVLHQVNKIGKNCDIHPTAYIEGSTIGDNVIIGAGSVVRLSVIGDGSAIGSNVTIESSILGEECTINSGCTVFFSVLYPRAVSSSRLLLTSTCGRDTFISDLAGMADFRIDGKRIEVMKNGVPVNTGVINLGACLGHGVYLGGGCGVAPATAIPNGLRILPKKPLIGEVSPDGTIPGHRVINTQHISRSPDASQTSNDSP
jgi:acetyltransferase-like isoleucine patch superfamily enzyme